jgi:hypothetical protein
MIPNTAHDRAQALVALHLPVLSEDAQLLSLDAAAAAAQTESELANDTWDRVLAALPEGVALREAWALRDASRNTPDLWKATIHIAQEAVQRLTATLPEGVAATAATARSDAASALLEARRLALGRNLAPAIVDAYRREPAASRTDFLLAMATAVPDATTAAWLCAGLLEITQQEHDLLLAVPPIRLLVARAVSPDRADHLPVAADEPIRTIGLQMFPEGFPFSREGMGDVDTAHRHWRKAQVGGATRAVLRSVRPVSKEGVTTLEPTLVIRLDDGSLIGAPLSEGEAFLERANAGLRRQARGLV